MSLAWAAAVSGAAAAAALWLLLRFAAARLPLDVPNARSLHERPVPRVGGAAIASGVTVAVLAGFVPLSLALGLAAALAALSFADDLRPLPTVVRLAAHLLAAGVLAWYVLTPMHALELTLIALGIAWITNLYNFMDGSDGLAGGMSVAGFAVYAIAASLAGDAATAHASAALAGAAAAFLAFNFPPARVFLGDVGSIPLGFLAAGLGVTGWRNDAWPLWFPLLVFAPFIGDASVTLVRRLLRRERVWQAHREHYYQRMVRMGLGHRGTAAVAYAAMLGCGAAALYGRTQAPAVQAAIFAFATLALAIVAVWVDVRWARHQRAKQGPA
jgi:UDP-N-acetylmuramyl pentapeptide phosphotransferase/UDP-N-acetylglucosamine-1-phosphate transferase